MNPMLRMLLTLLATGALLAITAGEARAYLGPGGVLTGVGALLALIVAVLAALFGFVWYPAKRFIRWITTRQAGDPSSTNLPREG